MQKISGSICLLILVVGWCWASDTAQSQARKRKSSRTQKAKAQPTPTPTPTPTPAPAPTAEPPAAPNPFVIVPRKVDQPSVPPPVSDKPISYKFKGKIVEIYRQPRLLAVEHEEIPGYMEAMTMKFPLKDESLYDKLKVGDLIEATLVVSQNSGHWWLDDVVVKRK